MTDGTGVESQPSKSDIEEFTGRSSENIDMGVINAWQAALSIKEKVKLANCKLKPSQSKGIERFLSNRNCGNSVPLHLFTAMLSSLNTLAAVCTVLLLICP